MAKVALLIGVRDYGEGFPTLLTPLNDIEALKKVLLDPEKGGFDEVKTLPNPDPVQMEKAIRWLFAKRKDEDLILLYFSGHGDIDENGQLYFATCTTCRNERGELLKTTTFPASLLHEMMSKSSWKQQVLILDCCYSGTFADGLLPKDNGVVNVKKQLGEKGRVVLTSSTSTQLSFAFKGAELSVYTHYLVEGIESGAADVDEDGVISVADLHEYTKNKVQGAFHQMNPEIYAVQPERLQIPIAKAPVINPRLKYRKEIKRLCSQGEISGVVRAHLNALINKLQLLPEDAAAIEAEVLEPIQEYKQKLQLFEEYLREVVRRVISE